ncbi:MAG: hypothetical protein M3O67_09365, partial [Bacteroidota bacterium]|nr:hypothetical protein [Bacteroidota bacterium]
IVTVSDWINYAPTVRYKPDGSGIKPFDQVMDEFMQSVVMNYYRDHLEDYNEDFRSQINEFKDGNLFFEIMQREIWSKAQSDSTALEAFYEKNKTKYTWNKSAGAIIFFCSDENTGNLLYSQVIKKPLAWKSATESFGEKVITDSARYEWEQIPNHNKLQLKPGLITSPVINNNDKSASFAYIIKVYTQPSQKSFTEARGLVINDYQNFLEETWIQELKKKYPVVIDRKVLESISK